MLSIRRPHDGSSIHAIWSIGETFPDVLKSENTITFQADGPELKLLVDTVRKFCHKQPERKPRWWVQRYTLSGWVNKINECYAVKGDAVGRCAYLNRITGHRNRVMNYGGHRFRVRMEAEKNA